MNQASDSYDLQKKTIENQIRNLNSDPIQNKEHISVLQQVICDLEAKDTKKRSFITWPSSSSTAQKRDRVSMNAIYELIEESENGRLSSPLTTDRVKGVVSKSLLFDLNNFNFVSNTPTEYMHSACLGICLLYTSPSPRD